MEDEGYLRDPSAVLEYCGIKNETEISLFNFEAYKNYKKNPVLKWCHPLFRVELAFDLFICLHLVVMKLVQLGLVFKL
ncbi:UPF0538 protein [Zancudomyces culisetae]|uniref:UPF0538 protein n=1 Tax=Zancudomyces culisetae TaxID=1213189 RepID=A0A1R1PU20_ZANCU|nr:UPF0538 protein [Zancudomyces culisetae]|eukprot:OMH84458.1 UPF0538 protein [Zancudomyces culisetae]